MRDRPAPTANLRIQVAQALALRILDGDFKPGETLPTEARLCDMTGVSRTTLRGAIQALAAKGLIEVGPSRGTIVRPKDQWNMLDGEVIQWRLDLGVTTDLVGQIYELRECFEPQAGNLAARRGSPADHDRIRAAFEAMVATREDDEQVAAAADVEFHLAILGASQNDFITSFGNILSAALHISFEIARERRALSSDDIAMHRAIMEAILAHDGPAAEESTRALLASSKEVQLKAVARAGKSTPRPAG